MAIIILIFIGAIAVIFWGIAHLIFTKGVVKDFGDISKNNRLIITMEWIMEGLTMIFIGLLVILITLLGGINNIISIYVYWISSVMLLIMAVVSLLTGARVNFPPYRLCPIIFTASAVLIIIGSLF